MPQTTLSNAAYSNKYDAETASPLAVYLKSLYPSISTEALEYINSRSFFHSVKKGGHLYTVGDDNKYLFLITKGVLINYVMEEDKKVVNWISAENEIVYSARDFYSTKPAQENVKAVEDVFVTGLSYGDLQYLYNNFIEMNAVGRLLLQKYCGQVDMRSHIVKIPGAETRYNYFIQAHEALAQRILLRYTASYLGITLETLSRVRNRMASGGSLPSM